LISYIFAKGRCVTLIVNIMKGDDDYMNIMCLAWLEDARFFMHKSNKTLVQAYADPRLMHANSVA
jgi:hypothetical protein